MDAFAGAMGVSDSDGKMSPVVHIYQVPDDNPHYIAHLLRVAANAGYIQSLARGIRERSTSFDRPTLKDMILPRPQRSEQDEIVTYLDREMAKIDALIAEQEGLVEVLRERRAALISHVVVMGVDQAVDMKEVTVGDAPLRVPAHWTVVPLRYVLAYQEGPGILAADFRDEGVPLLRVSGVRRAVATLDGCNYLDVEMVNSRWSHFRVGLGDLLISASASMGTVSKVETDDVVGAIPYTGIIKITPGAMLADFIRWFVVSSEFLEQVESLKTGSTIQHFGPSHLSQMRVALPPADEQREIAAYLDEQTDKIDALIAEAEGIVAVAKERRMALITAAVTGQIDVRGEVA